MATAAGAAIVAASLAEKLEKAQRLADSGNRGQAVLLLQRALCLLDDRKPATAAARSAIHRDIAQYYALDGDLRSSIRHLELVKLLSPAEATVVDGRLAAHYEALGDTLLADRRVADARTEFAHSLALVSSENLQAKIIDCLLAEEQYSKAFATLKAAMRQGHADGPAAPGMLLTRARIFVDHENYSAAANDVAALKSVETLSLQQQQRLADLEQRLQTVAEKSLGLAHASIRDGEIDQAYARLTTCLAANPKDVPSLLQKGCVERYRGDFEAAVSLLQLAVTLAKAANDEQLHQCALRELAATHNEAGVALERHAESVDAVGHFGEAIKLSGGRHRRCFINRASVLHQCGDLQQAASDYQAALILDPDDYDLVRPRLAQVLYELVVPEFDAGHFVQCDADLTRILELHTATPYLTARASARIQLGNTAGAAEDIVAALNLQPTDEHARALATQVFPGRSVSELVPIE